MAELERVSLLCCGSFNPITHKHLRMFELARDALHRSGRYHVVGGIVSPVSDDYGKKVREYHRHSGHSAVYRAGKMHYAKPEGLLPSNQRCDMVARALQTSDWIRLDTWESNQPTWLETAKVLRHHQDVLSREHYTNFKSGEGERSDAMSCGDVQMEFASHRPVTVKFLCGGDVFDSFTTPGLWTVEDIEDIVGRYGVVVISRSHSNPEKIIHETDMLSKHQKNIYLVKEWMNYEFSSTEIRRALRRGESVKYFLPETVIDYIRTNELYGCPGR